jgi:hypothetical protein
MTVLVQSVAVVLRLSADGATAWTGVSPDDHAAMVARGEALHQAQLQGWLTTDNWHRITDAGRTALTRLEAALG